MKDRGIARTFWDEIARIRAIIRETANYKEDHRN